MAGLADIQIPGSRAFMRSPAVPYGPAGRGMRTGIQHARFVALLTVGLQIVAGKAVALLHLGSNSMIIDEIKRMDIVTGVLLAVA